MLAMTSAYAVDLRTLQLSLDTVEPRYKVGLAASHLTTSNILVYYVVDLWIEREGNVPVFPTIPISEERFFKSTWISAQLVDSLVFVRLKKSTPYTYTRLTCEKNSPFASTTGPEPSKTVTRTAKETSASR
jgi:hypothetical protein